MRMPTCTRPGRTIAMASSTSSWPNPSTAASPGGKSAQSIGSGAATPYRFTVVSPEFPPPDGIQSGFNGDYSGLTINRDTEAHPIWSDTRNVNPFPLNGVVHDEDVFSDKTGLPDGRAHVGQGTLGKSATRKA